MKEKLERDENKQKDEQEKIIKGEQERVENESKITKYKTSKDIKILKSNSYGEVTNCPLKIKALQQFCSSRFYSHPVFKRIIDGGFWNGDIYGRMPNGKFFYLDNKKTIVYPPDKVHVAEIETRNNKLLHAGLIKLQPIIRNPKYGNCKECKLCLDKYYVGNNDYYVCGYMTEPTQP